jgi:hypothetical protein
MRSWRRPGLNYIRSFGDSMFLMAGLLGGESLSMIDLVVEPGMIRRLGEVAPVGLAMAVTTIRAT